MAAAFATPPELEAFLGDSGLEESQAQLTLDVVSDEIREAVGWSVTAESGVTKTLDGSGLDELLLPTLRLTSVSEVTENGTLLASDKYLVYERGSLRRVSSGWPATWTRKPHGVTVVFDHGYSDDQVPAVFKHVTLETAGRMLDNPTGLLKSRTVGRVAVTYADIKAQVPPIEDQRLDFYRLPEGF
ncbi:hypothetical protein [Streptomyces sp. NPDC007063]|uniref:hypothetical protein n=1 Tax=Streptomyces sp. NPDC007063 TaxID=3364772 RepID=UPI00367F0E63